MINPEILGFVLVFGIYSRVKTYEVTNLTITVQPFRANRVKYEDGLLEKIQDYKLNSRPNIQSDILDLTSLERPRIRRNYRQLHNSHHSLVPSTHPIVERVNPSLSTYLKGILNIVIPSSPKSYFPLKDLNLLHSNRNQIFKSLSSNLLLKNRKVNFHQVTTHSTVYTGLTLLSDESMILTTEINTIDRSQISNNAVHQEFEDILFLFDNFSKSLEQFERRFYQAS